MNLNKASLPLPVEITTTRLAKHKCPGCGETLSAASGFAGASPEPGDMTICGYCASVLRSGEELKIRLLTRDEWDTELDTETKDEIQRMVLFVKHKLALRPHTTN